MDNSENTSIGVFGIVIFSNYQLKDREKFLISSRIHL